MEKTLSHVRHGIRGYINSIKLCVSALELDCTAEEQSEFLDDVIVSADKLVEGLDDLEAIFQAQPASESGTPF